jgi:hypothetical protein
MRKRRLSAADKRRKCFHHAGYCECATPCAVPATPPPAAFERLGRATLRAMDGTEWSADTLDSIAEAARAAGFTIREPGDHLS